MNTPDHHIVICSSSRMVGEPKGGCLRKNAPDLVQYIETELADRGIENVLVTNTGCLKRCDQGPVMVVYPEAHWYGEITEDRIDTILDALEAGAPAQELLMV
ncbi:MAG: (2Fe-2S) ferredoxin domain-containing protein [Capsulimonadaceae bacterium]